MAIKIQGTTVIDNSRNATALTELSFDTITLNGTTVVATADEINRLDGVTGPINDQLGSLAKNRGTLNKTFTTGESATITLDPVFSGDEIPAVSVTKEVPQENITNNNWDVAADGSNFTLHDTAYDTTLTPSNASGSGTFTLGTGSFGSEDVGKRIVGNGGEAVLTGTDGSYTLITPFNDTSIIGTGDWSMFALRVISDDIGLSFNRFDLPPENNAPNVHDVFGDGSIVATWPLENNGNDLGGNYPLTANSNNFSSSISKFGTFSYFGEEDDSLSHYLVRQNSDIDVSGPQNDGSFTLSGWIRPTADSLIGFSSIYVLGQPSNYDQLQVNCRDGEILMQHNGAGSLVRESSNLLVADEWQHIALTYNSTTRDLKTYLNGIQQRSYSDSDGMTEFEQISILFSIEPDSGLPFGGFETGQQFDGYFDQTRLFNRELSQGEIGLLSGNILFFVTGTNHTAITTVSTNTEFWTDINSMTADDTLNDGAVYYAVSTDDRTTWSIIDDTNGVRNIVRNNGGTWEVNDASDYSTETWVAASENDEFSALEEAVSSEIAATSIPFASIDQYGYNNISFDLSSEATSVNGLDFNDDGTKMYTADSSTNSILQYTLSTAFDLSTASYDNVSFDVSSQTDLPEDVTFNNSGTQMYMTDTRNELIHQYTLGTAFDLSTASYDSVSLDVSGQDTASRGLIFNNDGTQMYMVGSNSDFVHQYTLSTAFDLSTASYDNVSLDVSGQDTAPEGITFNNDGTKLYMVGKSSDFVHQYTLSTAFDLSTASYDNVSLDVSGAGAGPTDVIFNNDGTKLYVTGDDDNAVYQYDNIISLNRMDSTQLNAVTDPNHYTPENNLDLAITMFMPDGSTSSPTSDGVSINYDGNISNIIATPGVDYNYFSSDDSIEFEALSAENFKIRVV